MAVDTTEWLGLVTDADPHDLPPGAAQVQTNLVCLAAGKLRPRRGVRRHTFSPVPSGTAQITNCFRYQTRTGDYVAYSDTSGNVFIGGKDSAAIETSVSNVRKSCWCRTRREELIRVNGLRRGTIYRNGTVYPLGITAPTTAPTVTTPGGGNAYAGDYQCGYRYVDKNGDSVYSSLSPLATVTADANDSFSWTVPRSTEARVTHIELYRSLFTTTDKFFLVTTLTNPTSGDATYTTDTLSDEALLLLSELTILFDDKEPNARRFTPPPEDMELVTSFQDRYWYARPANDTLANYKTQADWETEVIGRTIVQTGAKPATVTSITSASGGTVITLNLSDSTTLSASSTTARVGAPLDYNNTLYYSEIDEPESVPLVNTLVVADNVGEADEIVALIPRGDSMLVVKSRYCYRFNFTSNPRYDAAVSMVASRGVVNPWCWVVHQDTVYLMDRSGAWSLSAGGYANISDRIQNLWREAESPETYIDFTKSDYFFASVEPSQGVVRWHVHFNGDTSTRPKKAICYNVSSQKWWIEEYAVELGGFCRLDVASRQRCLVGGPSGKMLLMNEGTQDHSSTAADTAVTFTYRSGIMELPYSGQDPARRKTIDPDKRDLTLTFEPTTITQSVNLKVYYDHDATATTMKQNYSSGGISTAAGSANLAIDMKKARSGLGNSPGIEVHSLAMRSDPRSLSHRYLALELTGSQTTEQLTFYGLRVDGINSTGNE